MMSAMMGSGMAMGLGVVWLLVVVDLVLIGAAATKYLFFDKRR